MMRFMITLVTLVILPTMLSGCATLPDTPDDAAFFVASTPRYESSTAELLPDSPSAINIQRFCERQPAHRTRRVNTLIHAGGRLHISCH